MGLVWQYKDGKAHFKKKIFFFGMCNHADYFCMKLELCNKVLYVPRIVSDCDSMV